MEEDFENLEKSLLNLITDEKSEFEWLYKNWGKLERQEERRAQLLEAQKRNRQNKVDKFRGILDLVQSDEENSSRVFKQDKTVAYRPNIYVAGFNKTSLTYSNVLMLSEWLVEKPSDFAENWYVVPCPKGMRLLAVAINGITKFYSKNGNFKFERHTGLPGGNPQNCSKRNSCVLDCFYYELSNTLYILDLLVWNNQPMTDGETEFRQYWLKMQLEDFPDIKIINDKNKVLIKILPMMQCTINYLSHLLSTYPLFENNAPPLDGLLFYHKHAHYVAGETPLVGWLFPFMVPEVIGNAITIHAGYLAEMPVDYDNQTDYIKQFEQRNEQKLKKRIYSMETEDFHQKNKSHTKKEPKYILKREAKNVTSMETFSPETD